VTGADASAPHLRHRHLRLRRDGVESSSGRWIPAFAGMTSWARRGDPVC